MLAITPSVAGRSGNNVYNSKILENTIQNQNRSFHLNKNNIPTVFPQSDATLEINLKGKTGNRVGNQQNSNNKIDNIQRINEYLDQNVI
jgi:hypothetical protein